MSPDPKRNDSLNVKHLELSVYPRDWCVRYSDMASQRLLPHHYIDYQTTTHPRRTSTARNAYLGLPQ